MLPRKIDLGKLVKNSGAAVEAINALAEIRG